MTETEKINDENQTKIFNSNNIADELNQPEHNQPEHSQLDQPDQTNSEVDETVNTNDFTEHFIEKILDRRRFGYVTSYLVKWEGYPQDKATWVPADRLEAAQDFIDQYKKQRKYEKSILKYNELPLGFKPKKVFERASKNSLKTYTEVIEENVLNDTISEKSSDNEERKSKIKKKLKIKTNIKDESNDKSDEENKVFVIEELGYDFIDSIITVKVIDSKICCKVSFKPTHDNKIRPDAFVETSKLPKYSQELLVDFYISKLRYT